MPGPTRGLLPNMPEVTIDEEDLQTSVVMDDHRRVCFGRAMSSGSQLRECAQGGPVVPGPTRDLLPAVPERIVNIDEEGLQASIAASCYRRNCPGMYLEQCAY